ncbi:BTAD domain-containing putative transcriptional regulator [Streptomyces sp. NPDC092296]|uniref:BTAD domain-containing putative transcriptional regulator n=1 Tax=Streptomyces sp. NPDC092296 TaxID=3366012 RepID=UPI003816751B
MRYGILGTTQAHRDDGTPVPVGGARLRALLAALALRQGRPVPADVLVEEVWDGDPPQDGPGALQTLVGRLRRALGREAVGSGPEGYRLLAAADDIDLGRFQRLVGEAEQAMGAGHAEQAAGLLREALALWRGPALADLPDRAAAAARCEAQRLAALRRRIAAELSLGRAAQLVPELEELSRDNPLDEQLHALLIRALRAEGRTAQALQAYEVARRALADGLGADPGPELRTLHRELLLPPGRTPAPSPTPAAIPAPAPAGAVPPAGGNLRARLTSFVGRETELTALADTLCAARLITLTGPGGSGKTRLSLEAARKQAAAGRWPDGVWIAELAPLDDPAAVPGAVLSAIGLRETVLHHGKVSDALETRPADPVQRLVEHCAERRMLLLLDNCEHLVQASAELADRLLTGCPGVTVLATSREPLGVPGETVRPVDPLPDPAALRLLAERGAAARPGFDPGQDPQAAAEICRRLDGLPLAIELAAARLRGMTLRQVADRLDSRFRLLSSGSRTLQPRQQTLRAVVDWSWDLLAEDERALLARLSVFVGGCTLEAAEQVCADGTEVAEEEVAGLLLSLVDKSLVVADLDHDGGPARYRMLETIHEYADERLTEADGDARRQVSERHIRFFRELVRTAEPLLHGPEQLRVLARLEREQDNIRAALRRAIETRQEHEALCLVIGMGWFWALRDYGTEAVGWCEAVGELGPDPLAADPYAADPDGTAPAPLAVAPPWEPAVALEARRQVRLYRLLAGFEDSMAQAREAEVAEDGRRLLAAYPPELPRSSRSPAAMRIMVLLMTGQMDRMPDLMDQLVDGARRYGSSWDLALVLQLRAKLTNDRCGGLAQAARDSDESLEIFERLGDRWGISETLSARAEAAGMRGEYAEAAASYGRAIELAEELGARQEVPILRVRRGEALLGIDPAAGERLIAEGVEHALPQGRTGAPATFFGRLLLMMLAARRGEQERARELLGLLRANASVMGPLGPEVFDGLLSAAEGWLLGRFGRPEEGVLLVRRGIARIRAATGPAGWFANMIVVLLFSLGAHVLARLGAQQAAAGEQAPEAARRAAALLGAHQALSDSHHRNFTERLELAESEQLLRTLLGDAGYEAEYARGGRLDTEEAATLLDTDPR